MKTRERVAIVTFIYLAMLVGLSGLFAFHQLDLTLTPSIPQGIYYRTNELPRPGSIVALKPFWPGDVRRLKYVLGDSSQVGVVDGVITAYGRTWGTVSPQYRAPNNFRFTGPGVFAFAPHPRSTDSRYFGYIPLSYIDGTYKPLLTFPRSDNVLSNLASIPAAFEFLRITPTTR